MTVGRAPEIQLDGRWVAAAVSGSIVAGDAARTFTGVSIDTRTIGAGELYVGIRGERFDGSDFAGQAVAAGAAGVLVARGRGAGVPGGIAASERPAGSSPMGSAVVIEVDDTTAALQALAHRVRVESGTKVVAITGSAGKTTTKEVTAEFLAARYDVVRNRGNLNNHIGLPLALTELRRRPDIAVVELGMNHAGEISTLVRIAEPDVRVWTNVGEAHLEFFASPDAIADAKAEILERAAGSTVLVANADDDRIVARIRRFAGRTVTFGIDRPADVRATAVDDRGIDGMRARVSTRAGDFDLVMPLVGRANLANALAAAAVALQFDVPVTTIAERSGRLRPAAHRGEIRRLARGITIIDDSYNANPTATTRALEVLAHAAGAVRRIAVLGEMLELGARSAELHEAVGTAAARLGIDRLITVGGAPAQAAAAAAIAAGLPPAHVTCVPTSDEAAELVSGLVARGDVVLVKGSRGIRTDRVVERLEGEGG